MPSGSRVVASMAYWNGGRPARLPLSGLLFLWSTVAFTPLMATFLAVDPQTYPSDGCFSCGRPSRLPLSWLFWHPSTLANTPLLGGWTPFDPGAIDATTLDPPGIQQRLLFPLPFLCVLAVLCVLAIALALDLLFLLSHHHCRNTTPRYTVEMCSHCANTARPSWAVPKSFN